MKKHFLFLALLLSALCADAQPIINSWKLNTTGKTASYWANTASGPGAPSYVWTTTTDSADALRVCYNNDTVWVYSHNMTDSMGKWTNPGNPVTQTFTHRFPRTPIVPTTKAISPKVGEIGVLINGIVIYGIGDAKSWSGTTNADRQQGGLGIWNLEVGKGEGVSLDNTLGAHPQQQGVYHTHVAPFKLWNRLPTTQHSPIVGWAFDGHPIYGPYGYSTAMDATSGITRMKTGYSLRNITTRTAYPAIPGGGSTTSQAGPAVSTTYPIGTYCEDWEWLSANGGDLDEHNGRTCVTPEFPGGTYAYFTTIDAAGVPVFPYYVGVYYHAQPDAGNFPQGPAGNSLSIPSYLSSCLTATAVNEVSGKGLLRLYPNPTTDVVTIDAGHGFNLLTIVNLAGQVVYRSALNSAAAHSFELPIPGIYLARFDAADGSPAVVQRVVRR